MLQHLDQQDNIFIKLGLSRYFFFVQNGRRYLTSSRNEVSRDLIVTESSKKKQALLVFYSPESIYDSFLQIVFLLCSLPFQILHDIFIDFLRDLYHDFQWLAYILRRSYQSLMLIIICCLTFEVCEMECLSGCFLNM